MLGGKTESVHSLAGATHVGVAPQGSSGRPCSSLKASACREGDGGLFPELRTEVLKPDNLLVTCLLPVVGGGGQCVLRAQGHLLPLGEQLQHLPEALHLPQRCISGLIHLLHQGLSLLDCQLSGTALQPLEVVQQGGKVLIRDLQGEEGSVEAQGMGTLGSGQASYSCGDQQQWETGLSPCACLATYIPLMMGSPSRAVCKGPRPPVALCQDKWAHGGKEAKVQA